MLKETVAAAVLFLGAATPGATGGGMAPAKGRFLIAERGLRDPNFSETVVLLTEHGDSGAMGLIVNWPTAAPAAELVPQAEGLGERAGTVFVGGPVARRVMLMLLRSAEDLPEAERVFADVHLSTSRELLGRPAAGEIRVDELRMYSGYAGWSPGQLEMELAAGGWRVLPAESELVFAAEPETVWEELMRRGNVQWTSLGPATSELSRVRPASASRRTAPAAGRAGRGAGHANGPPRPAPARR